jgi:hypothetical protein
LPEQTAIISVRVSAQSVDLVVLGGVVVIAPAVRPEFHGFKPGRERWILKGDKNPYHDFLRRGSKPDDLLKIPSGMIEILIGKIQRPFLAQLLPISLLDMSAATRSFVRFIDGHPVVPIMMLTKITVTKQSHLQTTLLLCPTTGFNRLDQG